MICVETHVRASLRCDATGKQKSLAEGCKCLLQGISIWRHGSHAVVNAVFKGILCDAMRCDAQNSCHIIVYLVNFQYFTLQK